MAMAADPPAAYSAIWPVDLPTLGPALAIETVGDYVSQLPSSLATATVPVVTTTSSSSSVSTAATTTTTTPTSTTASEPATTTYPYKQLQSAAILPVRWTTLAKTPFDALCPSGNCLEACKDFTRVFKSHPDGADEAAPITLFGLCSNLGVVYRELYQYENPILLPQSSYFPNGNGSEADLNRISAGLSNCLVSSCELSRDAQNCNQSCGLSLINNGDTTMSVEAAGSCLYSVCGNTCGLPYADQDIYGVGILISYVMQAILVLVLAAVLISIAVWFDFRSKSQPWKQKTVKWHFGRFLKDFLSAQCYFGVFLQVAALCSDPDSVDPLNGYALLSVAMTGFIPTVFTLVMLQYHRIRSWYHSGLTVICWLLATIVFWKLRANLSGLNSDTEIEDAGLQRLYQLPSCGGSSALVLCKQTMNTSPLGYLSRYYNYSGVLNVHSMPIVWAWSTLCLLSTLAAQLIARYRKHSELPGGQTSTMKVPGLFLRSVSHWSVMIVVAVIFGLCLGYQAQMVQKYASMDVIDWDGWKFGQIIAVTVWFPPILDYLHKTINRAMGRSMSGDHMPSTP